MSRLKVLLVADDRATRELVEGALAPWNDELSVLVSASAAMETERVVDVALVDLAVQKGAGLALVHFFRAKDPELAIVALTPEGDVESQVVARALGVTATVHQPLTGDELLVALSPIRERKSAYATASARHSTLPLAPVLQAPDARALGLALAQTARELTGGPARVVLEDARDGEVELRSGDGAATEAIPLAAHDETIGTLYVAPDAPRLVVDGVRRDLDMLALSAATVGVLLRRVESVARVGIKDPETSAYTFAYFVDVAGREIERARRHDRRFGLLTFLIENYTELCTTLGRDALREARRELVDTILDGVRDSDVLAHVEDDEMYLLVPDTGMLGALAIRRRIAERQTKRAELARLEGRASVQVNIGVATYPRDGRDLTSLLRAAHKRGGAARASAASALLREASGLDALLGALLRHRPEDGQWQIRQCALSTDALGSIATAVAREANGGSVDREGVVYIVGNREHPLVRNACDALRPATGRTAAYWLRPQSPDKRGEATPLGVRASPVEIEVDGMRVGPFALLAALTEGWAYACLASNHGEYKRVMHTCDLELVEGLVAELQTTFHLQRGIE